MTPATSPLASLRGISCGAVVPTLTLLAAACQNPDSSGSSPDVVVRDSSGIRIVENLAPEWDKDFWSVNPEPEFAFGGEFGEESDASLLVWDIAAAGMLSDGRVVLLSPKGERKVLIFERSGALSVAFGRAGRGPGEFDHPQHLQVLPGDTVVVWDYMFGPVSYFDASGTLLKHRAIDLGGLIEATRGPDRHNGETVHLPLPDGSFIVQFHRPDWQIPEQGEIYRRPVGYARIDLDYSSHSFGWWQGYEFLNHAMPVLPYPVQSLVAGGGAPLTVHVTNGNRFEVHQFAAHGEGLRRIVRRRTEKIPIESGTVRSLAELNSDVEGDWLAWERAVALTPQRFYPAIASMQVDNWGNLWVLALSGRSTRGGALWEWSVFHEGRWLGDVAMPSGVLWIGDDIILCRHFDRDTGLEKILGYRLSRGLSRG